MRKSSTANNYARPLAGLIMLLFLANALLLPMPVGASGLKRDMWLKNSHATFTGEKNGDLFGSVVSNSGDVNGDGFADILISAYDNSEAGSYAGQVYLFLGGPSGWKDGMDLGKADASFQGEKDGDTAGGSVAIVKDVNGDGYDDILIGAPNNNDGGAGNGKVYLIFGKTTGWNMDTSLAKVDASFIGAKDYDAAGAAVAGVGDVNNDGYGDFAIGASQNSDNGPAAGRTYLFFGKNAGWALDTKIATADASFYGIYNYDNSGSSIAGVGDVNNDGYDDFLIGAPYNSFSFNSAGETYLILGKASGWSYDTNLKDADASFDGEADSDASGAAVAGVGDVNRDGYDDFIIGAPASGCDGNRKFAGQTYLILGKAKGWSMYQSLSLSDASFWGEHDSDLSGNTVAGVGDVNGDGFDDFMIGALLNDDGAGNGGQTYLILGREKGWSMDSDLTYWGEASFIGDRKSGYSGCAIAGGFDVNGDGVPDFLIGAYNAGDDQQGMAYLYLTYSAPPAPDGLKGTSANDASSITIAWNDPANWNEPITAIRVYRSTDGSTYSLIGKASPGDQKFNDANVIIGKTYYYAVVTVDGTGALSDLGAPVAVLCDKDTDGDGLSDTIDPDDDGDGVPDFSDAFPLDSKEWIDTDLDGTGNNKDTDDDNDGIPDVNDAQQLNPLNGIQGDIKYMNTTLKQVSGDMVKIRTDLSSMDGNLTTLGTDLDAMDATLTAMMVSLGHDLDGLNDTTQAQVLALRTELQGVNASVKKDISTMATELHTFRLETAASLKEIKDLMAKHDKDMKAEMTNLNKTINQLEAKSLAQITAQLTVIEQQLKILGINDTALMTKITDTKTDIGNFRTSTDSKLQNISTQMSKLDTLQGGVTDLKKTQKTTNTGVDASGTRDMIMMALLALVIVLGIVGLVTGMRKKKA